jgi:hypothetical protein
MTETKPAVQAVARTMPGFAGSAKTKVHGIASKVLPKSLKATVHRQLAEPGSG